MSTLMDRARESLDRLAAEHAEDDRQALLDEVWNKVDDLRELTRRKAAPEAVALVDQIEVLLQTLGETPAQKVVPQGSQA